MEVEKLVALPAVARARSLAVALQEETFAEQRALAAIPAPTGEEAERGRYVEARLTEIGLERVSTDEVGNVLGLLPHPADPSAAPLLVAAHLDTVFPAGTDLTPRKRGERIHAPGITDNARGVAALLTLARVLVECEIRTHRPLWLAATVGEEGLGDLRGMKHLFREDGPFRNAAGVVCLDGSGLRRVVHRALGSRRLRAAVLGPGGHSWADWGVANPVLALGAAVEGMSRINLPAAPRTTLTAARIGGGTAVNAIPESAWLELDLRSEDAAALARVEAEAREALEAATNSVSAHRRAGTPPLRLEVEEIGDRPSGAVADSDPLVRAAVAATRAVHARAELAASSTDANVPIALGIPAVTLGAGGESGGIHTLEEWYSDRDAARGVERALLTVLVAAGVAE